MEVVGNLAKTTMEEIEKVLNTGTVVGEAITIGDRTLIPLISIGFGFGAGGGEGKGETKQRGEGTGGGTGGGAWVKPIAVIILEKEGVRVEPIRGGVSTAIENIGEAVPKMVENLADKWAERKKEK